MYFRAIFVQQNIVLFTSLSSKTTILIKKIISETTSSWAWVIKLEIPLGSKRTPQVYGLVNSERCTDEG